MKLGVLFSGGKDSTLALFKAKKEHEIVCLINIVSENPSSYMFHTPNIHLAEKQAECLGLPLLVYKTKGEKEKELSDLEQAIKEAVKKYHIEGIVTGALASVYQASRIQKICDKLKIKCVNPLWQMNQFDVLEELIKNNFKVMIIGVFAYPLDEKWLGRMIDKKMIAEMRKLTNKYGINPAGEGGEIETLVLDCLLFKKRIRILEYKTKYSNYSGNLMINKVELEEK